MWFFQFHEGISAGCNGKQSVGIETTNWSGSADKPRISNLCLCVFGINGSVTTWLIFSSAKPAPETRAHLSQLHQASAQGLSYTTTCIRALSYLGIKPRDRFWTWRTVSNSLLFTAFTLHVAIWRRIFQLMLFTLLCTKAPCCQEQRKKNYQLKSNPQNLGLLGSWLLL